MDVLYLVRHGQTEWNRDRRMQGRRDSALTEAGIAHANTHAALLEREGIDHLVVSPLGRARTTAAKIGAACGIAEVVDDRLVERSFGLWEGLTHAEIEAAHAAEWQAHQGDPFHHRPPQGENVPDVMRRVEPLLAELRALPQRHIAIVSHGICGRALLAELMSLTPALAAEVRQPNELVYRLTFESEPRCEYFRDGVGPHPGLFRKLL